jgi:hypothetical protein
MRFAAGLRYPGTEARRGHIESWFLKANDPRSRRALWLRWTLWAGDRAPGSAIAEVWAIAFGTAGGPFAAKSGVPFRDGLARFDREGLYAAIDGCTLTPERAQGRVDSGGRAIAYDLTLAPQSEAFLHFGKSWMYADAWPWQKLASPMPSARVTGRVTVGTEPWEVDGWPAMVGHNWGHRHAPHYAWGHCNAWDGGEDLVVEGASVAAGGPLLGATLVSVRHEGVRHDFNDVLSLARNVGSITPRRWRFRGRSRRLDVDGEFWAETDDLVGLHYPNPDGSQIHCLNSEIARAEITLKVRGGSAQVYRSSRAALEIGTRDPHHGVRMVL